MIKFILSCRPYSKYILIILSLTIIIISSIPDIPTLKIQTAKSSIRLDYLIHFCEYGVLAFVAYLSATRNDFRIRITNIIIITASLIAFAVLDELHQKLIPGRTYNIKDMLSNITGILSGLMLTLLIFRLIRNRL